MKRYKVMAKDMYQNDMLTFQGTEKECKEFILENQWQYRNKLKLVFGY